MVEMAGQVTISHPSDNDIPQILAAMRTEEWQVEEKDIRMTLKCFGKTDWFVARLNAEIAGQVAVYTHGDHFGYISLFLVKKEYRGKDIGRMLFDRAMEHLGERTAILDSLPAAHGFYAKKGFFQDPNNAETFHATFNTDDIRVDMPYLVSTDHVTGVNDDNIEMVMTYDMTLHPCGYRKYFRMLLAEKSTIAFCSIDDGTVNGLVFYNTTNNCLSLYAAEDSITPLMHCMMRKLKEFKNITSNVYITGENEQQMISLLHGFGVSISTELLALRMSTQEVLPSRAKDVRCMTGSYCTVI